MLASLTTSATGPKATESAVAQQQRFVGEQRNQIDIMQNGDDGDSLLVRRVVFNAERICS